MRERSLRGALMVGIVIGALASTHVASAAFTDGTTASASYSAGALAAPTSPSATAGTCSTITGDRTVLSWTASTSSWASGYEIARSTTSGGPYTVIATVSGVSTTTYTDAPPAFSTTYYYAIRSTKHAWRSANATTSRTTKSSLCL
ncbi:MAG: hypothetical protein ACT4OV_09370 [Microthrixaceae bacterium]